MKEISLSQKLWKSDMEVLLQSRNNMKMNFDNEYQRNHCRKMNKAHE